MSVNEQSVSDLYDMLHDYYANAAVEMGAEKLPNDDLKDIEQAGATLRIQPERTARKDRLHEIPVGEEAEW